MMKIIKSEDNKYIKLQKSLYNKKYREKYNMFFDEGTKNIQLSMKSNYNMKFSVVTEQYYEKNIDFIEKIYEYFESKNLDKNVFVVDEKLFEKISDTVNYQGIMAVYEKYTYVNEKSDKILILDRLQDPGNMGTIIRTADAFGINNIYYTKGSVDVFSPKVVRSTMGSIYFSRFYELNDVSSLKEEGYKIYATTLDGAVSSSNAFTDDKIALVMGNEANGISKDIIDMSDKKIKIDMSGNAQSLNVAIASAILMYEMMRG